MYYEIPSTNYAIVKDFAGLPIRVYDTASGTWCRSGEIDKKVRVESTDLGSTDKGYYFFNTDGDDGMEEPKLYVEYAKTSSTTMQVKVQMVTCDRTNPGNLQVWVGSHYLGTCGSTWTRYASDWGFASNMYVCRDSMRMAKHYYDEIGSTTKKTRIQNFLTAYNYNGKDVYDPLFEASNSYPDDFFFDKTGTWPDPERWDDLPTGPYYHPLGTKLMDSTVRNLWVSSSDTPLTLGGSVLYKLNYALHIMNKYGSSRLSEAKGIIDSIGWDGYGIKPGLTQLGQAPQYVGVRTALFLAAVSKYADLTDDPFYLALADRVAGVVLDIQFSYPQKTEAFGSIYRPDQVGGFLTAYTFGSEMMFCSRPSWYWDMVNMLLVMKGNYYPTPCEGLTPEYSSSESTLTCLQALRLYKTLLSGRTPQHIGYEITSGWLEVKNVIAETSGLVRHLEIDKNGLINGYIQASQYGVASMKAGLEFEFTPSRDLINPHFECLLYEKGGIDANGGTADVKQFMTLKEGATTKFDLNRTIHHVAGPQSLDSDDFWDLNRTYIGTLQKDTAYTLQVGLYAETSCSGSVYYGIPYTYWAEILLANMMDYQVDNFDDNSIDADLWQTLQASGGTVTEANKRLEVSIPSGSAQAQSGLVTKDAYAVENFAFEVDVPEFNSLDEMNLQIGATKTTSSDPWSQNNWYRICKTRYDGKTYIQKKGDGGDVTTTYSGTYDSASGPMKIVVSSDIISFYDNGNLIYAEPYGLSASKCYIYLFTSTLESRNHGTDAFDDFRYSYDLSGFGDDFDDGDYDGWTAGWGGWTVQNGKLKTTQSHSIIHTDEEFPKDRYVKADARTITTGTGNWQVAWVRAKYVDFDNQVYGGLKTDGNIELAVRYNGGQKGWLYYAGLNPCTTHTIEISVVGDRAMMWVDGTLYHDHTYDWFDNFGGTVALDAHMSTAEFDNVRIVW